MLNHHCGMPWIPPVSPATLVSFEASQDATGTWTYRQLRDASLRVAKLLQSRGVAREERSLQSLGGLVDRQLIGPMGILKPQDA